MILVNKESRGSYNAVIANVNQNISKLIKEAEALVSSSESATASQSESLNELIKKANRLLVYVNGLKEINEQIDDGMPSGCNYSWSYVENGCDFSEESACGE